MGVGALGAGLLLSACFGPGVIATQIGNGTAGYSGDGAKASAATLRGPQAVAVDASGNAYVADTFNCVIRGYDKSSGNISTVAGNGTCGFNGESGPTASIELNHPMGVAIGADGNLYIADADNSRIRVVDLTAQTIQTFAGSSWGAVDGDRLTTAKFAGPVGVAFDSSQNLYVADAYNEAIREINHTSGLVSTIAGTFGVSGDTGDNGPAVSATLSGLDAIAIDRLNDIFIVDAADCRVREIDTGGTIHKVAGTTCGYSGDGGDANLAQFNHPRGLAVDPDLNIYVSDNANNRIRMISGLDHTVSTVVGTGADGYAGDNGPGTSATVWGPVGLAIIPHDTLWIADAGNNRVRILGLAPLPTTTTTTSTVPNT
jgi:sugar lactone lactonase YvrE